MRHIEKTVFISYRRTNAPWALAIFKELTHNGYDAFFDLLGDSVTQEVDFTVVPDEG
jgi:hypothetical protein